MRALGPTSGTPDWRMCTRKMSFHYIWLQISLWAYIQENKGAVENKKLLFKDHYQTY